MSNLWKLIQDLNQKDNVTVILWTTKFFSERLFFLKLNPWPCSEQQSCHIQFQQLFDDLSSNSGEADIKVTAKSQQNWPALQNAIQAQRLPSQATVVLYFNTSAVAIPKLHLNRSTQMVTSHHGQKRIYWISA